MASSQDSIVRAWREAGAINAVRLTKDGNYLMIAGEDRTVSLYNPHKDDPNSLPFELGGEDGPRSALKIKTYSGVHGHGINDIAISADNTKFASAGGDRALFLWDVGTGRVIRKIQGHSQKINAIDFNNDATVLMSASYDKTLCCWDLRSNMREPIQIMQDFTDSVTSIARTDYAILAGSVDGKIRTYDIRSGLLHADNLRDPIVSVTTSNDQKCSLSMCLSGTGATAGIRLVEILTGQLLQEYKGTHKHESYKSEARISNDDACVIAGSEDGYLCFYNLVTGNLIRRTQFSSQSEGGGRKQYSEVISSLAVHPKLPFVVASTYGGLIKCISTAPFS
jgi:mitogen-activated protein kinase organizer 1